MIEWIPPSQAMISACCSSLLGHRLPRVKSCPRWTMERKSCLQYNVSRSDCCNTEDPCSWIYLGNLDGETLPASYGGKRRIGDAMYGNGSTQRSSRKTNKYACDYGTEKTLAARRQYWSFIWGKFRFGTARTQLDDGNCLGS